jgi:hypothetical protein
VPAAGKVVGEVGVGVDRGAKRGADEEATFPGERVYAICYRRVKVGFMKKVEDVRLEQGNRWLMYTDTRGAIGFAENAEWVEAELDSDLDEPLAEEKVSLDSEEFLTFLA